MEKEKNEKQEELVNAEEISGGCGIDWKDRVTVTQPEGAWDIAGGKIGGKIG